MSSENCKLADIALIQGGYAFKSADFGDEGVAVVKIANIKPPIVSLDGVDRVKPDKLAGLDRFRLNDGDVLMAMTGATVGKVGRFREREPAYLNQRVARISARHGKQYEDFIYAVVSQPGFDSLIEGASAGSAQANISAAGIGAVKIPLLNGEEQLVIGQLARALDDRITLLRETNFTLEGIAQALFKSWFVDFDPVRAKMADRAPEGMDEATAALFPDALEETELGLVPKGWRIDFIAPWLSILETGRRPKGGVGGISDGIPSIGAESIVRIGQFDFSKLKFVSNEFFTAMKAGRLTSRDVLLYKDGGKPGVFLPRVSMFGDGFPFDVCGINEHVFRIRLKEPFGQVFLYFWLWSDAVMHELKHRGGKAAIPGINQADVKELRLSVPSEPVLRRFEEICDPIVGQILNNAKCMQNLASLRDGLLPRLISGQLRLPDAQAQLETIA